MGSHWPRAGPAEAAPPSAKIRGHLADVGTNLVTITKVWTLQDIVYRRQLPLQEPEGKHSPVRGGWESSFLPGGEGSTKGAGWFASKGSPPGRCKSGPDQEVNSVKLEEVEATLKQPFTDSKAGVWGGMHGQACSLKRRHFPLQSPHILRSGREGGNEA